MKQKRALKIQKIERVVFNAITKQAITEAMQHPRQIDGALVDAYMARRALDYLVGFTLSPFCGANCLAPAPPAASIGCAAACLRSRA
jgi:DNA topoisomerase IA